MNAVDPTPFARAVAALVARRRGRLKTPPSPEELIAYREGTLPAAERERVERAIAAFPEAARTLADLAAFPRIEPADPSHRLTPETLAARREAFRRRLADALQDETPTDRLRPADAEAAMPAAALAPEPVRAFPSPAGTWRLPATLAALLALAFGGALYWALAVRGPQAAGDVAVLTLSPLPPPGERGGGFEAAVGRAEARGGITLRLALDGRSAASFEVTVRNEAGREIFAETGLRRQPDDTVTVHLPPARLRPGRYQVELHGGAARARYAFTLGP